MNFKDKEVKIFSLFDVRRNPSNLNSASSFFNEMVNFIKKSEKNDFDGILIPDSNDGPVNPWAFASCVLAYTKRCAPFIAINPLYAHPFFVAKCIANYSGFFQRRMYVNYITGANSNDSLTFGELLDHDQKYDRLKEYIKLVTTLLSSQNVSFSGRYYEVRKLSLPLTLDYGLMPVNFVAGSSAQAIEVATATRSLRLKMAPSLKDLRDETKDVGTLGFHFGIVARGNDSLARDVVTKVQVNRANQMVQAFSSIHSNNVWKKELHERAKSLTVLDTYSLLPFSNGSSDVPYLIGSYENVAAYILEYVKSGIELVIIEVPSLYVEDEFQHIKKVIRVLKSLVDRG